MKHMKKLLALLLAIVLAMSCITAVSAAEGAQFVSYPVPGGSILFDPATGTVTGYEGAITEANIPAKINGVDVAAIGESAFVFCDSLLSAVIPNSVTKIETGAFAFCENLISVTIPDSVRIIDWSAFAYCSKLANAVIPDSVLSIGGYAFQGCHSLMNVTIPATVAKIETGAFSGCSTLEGIWVDKDNPNYCSDESGVLFNKNKTLIISCPGALRGNYIIPDSVKTIGESAFEYCVNLTGVNIPDGITEIPYAAFMNCSSLVGVTIPDGVTLIDINAFGDCYNLNYVAIPASVARIGSGAILFSHKLSNIYFSGSQEQWEQIPKGDNDFSGIAIHCNETRPWHSCPSDDFADTPFFNHWAHDGIDYCVEQELMNGVGGNLFNPNGTVSRAQLVTILYRVAGSPETEFKGAFTDVENGKWYSNAIEWAAANGVVNGVGDGKFAPDQSITREQIATILYRYHGSPAVNGTLSSFPDAGSVSGFARNGLLWATQNEFVNGVSSGGVTSLAPQANATRAQIAAIIMRYCEAV